MSLDWENERYVKLYTRDTIDWCSLPWQGRAVWPLLMRKLDRGGRLSLGNRGLEGAAAGIAGLIQLPVEVVEPGLAALLADGTVVVEGTELVAPNFVPAQERPQSDAARAAAYRERKAAKAAATHAITEPDGVSQPVTPRHNESRAVTPSLTVPSCANSESPPMPPAGAGGGDGQGPPQANAAPPAAPKPPRKGAGKAKARPPHPAVDAARKLVVELGGPDYPAPASWDNLRARLTQGATEADVLAYLRWCGSRPWERDTVQFDPEILFRRARFASGVAKARASPADPVRGGVRRVDPIRAAWDPAMREPESAEDQAKREADCTADLAYLDLPPEGREAVEAEAEQRLRRKCQVAGGQAMREEVRRIMLERLGPQARAVSA